MAFIKNHKNCDCDCAELSDPCDTCDCLCPEGPYFVEIENCEDYCQQIYWEDEEDEGFCVKWNYSLANGNYNIATLENGNCENRHGEPGIFIGFSEYIECDETDCPCPFDEMKCWDLCEDPNFFDNQVALTSLFCGETSSSPFPFYQLEIYFGCFNFGHGLLFNGEGGALGPSNLPATRSKCNVSVWQSPPP